MNSEQNEYISFINRSGSGEILVKKTGWEEISLPAHRHGKCQILYTRSGTLYVQIDGTDYFVPERHIAWIPAHTDHRLSSNSRQVSLVIFYVDLAVSDPSDPCARFSIYTTNRLLLENLSFLSSAGRVITENCQPGLFRFASSFFALLPQMTTGADILLKTLIVPSDLRLQPILDYLAAHRHENLRMEQVAALHHMSVRNLSRLFHASGIHFSNYVNHLRVMRAIELLTDGGKTVQQVAYEVGFSTPNNFNRVFRQVTGHSPKAYVSGEGV